MVRVRACPGHTGLVDADRDNVRGSPATAPSGDSATGWDTARRAGLRADRSRSGSLLRPAADCHPRQTGFHRCLVQAQSKAVE